MGKDDGDAERDGGGPAQHEPDDEGDKALAEEKNHAPGEDRAGRNDDQSQVDRDAHGDEEQADEDVAKRAQIVFDAMPEVAAADHHAGDERTDRQGEARQIGEVGGAQRCYEKGRQEEQVARTGPGRAGKHRTDKRPGNDGDGRERDRRQPETPHEIEGVDRCLP